MYALPMKLGNLLRVKLVTRRESITVTCVQLAMLVSIVIVF